jgi:hypothetical protein
MSQKSSAHAAKPPAEKVVRDSQASVAFSP